MTAALIAMAVAFAVGCAAVFAAHRPLDREIAGEAWLLGIAICAGALFLLSLARIAWSIAAALVCAAVIAITLALIGARRSAGREPRLRGVFGWLSALFDLLTALTIAGYTLMATAGPLAEIDFVAAWGLKARMFWIARGIDWRFLENPWYAWIHSDYPPLLPLAFDWMNLFQGHWDDRWLGALNTCFALGLLFVVRSLLEDELGSAAYAAFATLTLAPVAASPWIGIAEGPLLAYGTVGVLLLRRAMRQPGRSIEFAAVFLGCAAMTKNEGLALLVAVILAMLATERERAKVWRLWPALAIATPWLVERAIHHLATDLASGAPWQRIVANVQQPMVLIHGIVEQSRGHGVFLLAVLLAILATSRIVVDQERFLLITIALVLSFDVLASLSTARGVAWIVQWSWERLLAQVTPLVAFLVAVLVYRTLVRRAPVEES